MLIGICVLFTGTFFVIVARYFYQYKKQSDFSKQIEQLQSVDRSLVETQDDPFFGNPNAEVVIVEFSDFTCPSCKDEFYILQEVMKKYSDKIKLIYRDFPISTEDTRGRSAAIAGKCAFDQDKFWPYYEQLFTHQNEIDDEHLLAWAKQVGMNERKFSQCLKVPKNDDEVQDDLSDGVTAGVEGTPTFFINGLRVRGAVPLNVWEQFIQGYYQE